MNNTRPSFYLISSAVDGNVNSIRDVVRLVAVVLVAVEVVAVLAARVDAVLAAFFATSVFSTDSTACADWLL